MTTPTPSHRSEAATTPCPVKSPPSCRAAFYHLLLAPASASVPGFLLPLPAAEHPGPAPSSLPPPPPRATARSSAAAAVPSNSKTPRLECSTARPLPLRLFPWAGPALAVPASCIYFVSPPLAAATPCRAAAACLPAPFPQPTPLPPPPGARPRQSPSRTRVAVAEAESSHGLIYGG